MKKLTDQEIFDTVARHLLSQGKRSTEFGFCTYRSEDGLKCAVGCLIADEFYSAAIEGYSIAQCPEFPVEADLVFRLFASGVDLSNATTRQLIADLQCCHDTEPPFLWADELYDIGSSLELDTHVLEECHR